MLSPDDIEQIFDELSSVGCLQEIAARCGRLISHELERCKERVDISNALWKCVKWQWKCCEVLCSKATMLNHLTDAAAVELAVIQSCYLGLAT